MKYYVISESELTELKSHLDRLYQLLMMIPGAIEHAMHGIEARRPILEEMLEEYQRPENLHDAICEEMGRINSLLTEIGINQCLNL